MPECGQCGSKCDDCKRAELKQSFDWVNNILMPLVGVGLLFAAWRYWGLPWEAIKEILFHDL